MYIVTTDTVVPVSARTPDIDATDPLLKVLHLVERVDFASERETYLTDSVQYLFPFESLTLSGPNPPQDEVCDPVRQDDKENSQQQTILDFEAGDAYVVRGWARAGDRTVPFLRLSYRAGPDSRLAKASRQPLGKSIRLWVRAGDSALPSPVRAPYNAERDRYEVELWGLDGSDLRNRLGTKGRASFDAGTLIARPDVVHGTPDDFTREHVSGQSLTGVAVWSTMHPVLPLHLEVAWGNEEETAWDSRDGGNYHYEFAMLVRGWDHFLRVGLSRQPHGGSGSLEYRNLFSSYGEHASRHELGRTLAPWNYDALGHKPPQWDAEPFLAMQYLDLHLLKGGSGIGLHRHRDNPDAFLIVQGQGYMVTGDWCKHPHRDRCLEVRTLRAGHLALIHGGQLHGLMNPSAHDLALFTFGGYD